MGKQEMHGLDAIDPDIRRIMDAAEPGIADLLAAYEPYEAQYMSAARVPPTVIVSGANTGQIFS